MISFFNELAERRIDETSKSAERENKKKASTTGNAENINLDITFQQILSSVFEILPEIEKIEIAEFSKKTKRMLIEVEIMMDNLLQYVITYPTINVRFDTHVMDLARTYFDLGCIYTLISNHSCSAIKHFEKVIELIKGKEMHHKVILIAIRVRIILSYIFANLQQPEEQYVMLEEAMELYIKYTNEEDEYPDPIDGIIAGNCPEEQRKDPKDVLFDLHMKTLEGLGYLYATRYTNMHKFVIHVHNLLNKHLVKVISTGNKPSIFWAHGSACLSDYFLFHGRFMEAKIHLAVADYVGRAYKLKFKDQIDSEKYFICKEFHAYTTRLWGKYGLKLLYLSHQRLINGKACEANNLRSKFLAKSEEELVKPLIFVGLENELEENCSIAHTYVSNFNDAKVVFKNVLKCFNTARTIFCADSAFWYHIDIILKMSSGYKYYTYFVGNRNEKIKLIKQQIQFLENNVNELFSKLTSDDYEYYKKLYFELAITYSTLLDMTYEEFNQIKDVTDEMKMELKQLTKNVLDNYKLYMKGI